MRSLDSYFADWEAETFGFGYGTGEQYTLAALKQFFGLLRDWDGGNDLRSYDYQDLEREMTPVVAWLMINALCKDGVIEYGTSPRHGWLDARGKRLKAYVDTKTVGELLTALRTDDDHPFHCGKTACNCGPNGYEKDRVCPNPFWAGIGGSDRA